MKIKSKEGLYNKFGIQQRYDDTTSFPVQSSHYGNGRYPPDWEERRAAIWWLQDDECARCGREKSDVDNYAVHHIHHLDDGGGNQLENLAGLCGDCHSLMHPQFDPDGHSIDDYRRAPMFPSESARDKVSVLRWPTTRDDGREELKQDFEQLAQASTPTVNRHAITEASVPTSPEDAKRAETELVALLKERSYIARTSPYHTVRISPSFSGLRGLFTRFEPPTTVRSDADLLEKDDWRGRFDRRRVVRFSEDATEAHIDLEDGHGEVVSVPVTFDEAGSERNVEVNLSPPFTRETAVQYLYNGLYSLVRTVLLLGALPALAAAFVASDGAPVDSSDSGLVVLAFLIGVLLTTLIHVRTGTASGSPDGPDTSSAPSEVRGGNEASSVSDPEDENASSGEGPETPGTPDSNGDHFGDEETGTPGDRDENSADAVETPDEDAPVTDAQESAADGQSEPVKAAPDVDNGVDWRELVLERERSDDTIAAPAADSPSSTASASGSSTTLVDRAKWVGRSIFKAVTAPPIFLITFLAVFFGYFAPWVAALGAAYATYSLWVENPLGMILGMRYLASPALGVLFTGCVFAGFYVQEVYEDI